MKNLYLLLIFSLSTQLSFGQSCDPATAQMDLNVNNVNARIKNAGDLWWDGADGKYIVPAPQNGEPEVSALFAGGLWVAGFDPGANLKLAAQTYGAASGQADYWAGYLEETGSTANETCSDFDRFWETTSEDINSFTEDWQDGTLDNPIPQSILAWPGNGNPEFFSIHGFELPMTQQGFAPYIDTNADGIYNPNDGDYPYIKDADQGIWWVFNDAGNIHTSSNGDVLRLEIQTLAYAYNSNNPNINNATFYDYKFINRSLENLDSAFVGLWVDPDLGCYTDDYVGCDSTANMGYVYNSDALDGNTSCNDCQGVNTYCEEIPVVGIKLLKGVTAEENGVLVDRGLSSFFSYNNVSVGAPNPSPINEPVDYYRALSGVWTDQTPFTVGGNGYNPGSTDYTNYLFHSPPDDPNGWSMAAENITLGDRRMLLNSGPFDFAPGQVNSISFVVLFVENVPHPNPSIDDLLEAGEDAAQLFQSVIVNTVEPDIQEVQVNLQPNPMGEEATLSILNTNEWINQLSIYSADGKLLETVRNVNEQTVPINRKDRASGLYYYHVTISDGSTASGKFIIR